MSSAHSSANRTICVSSFSIEALNCFFRVMEATNRNGIIARNTFAYAVLSRISWPFDTDQFPTFLWHFSNAKALVKLVEECNACVLIGERVIDTFLEIPSINLCSFAVKCQKGTWRSLICPRKVHEIPSRERKALSFWFRNFN